MDIGLPCLLGEKSIQGWKEDIEEEQSMSLVLYPSFPLHILPGQAQTVCLASTTLHSFLAYHLGNQWPERRSLLAKLPIGSLYHFCFFKPVSVVWRKSKQRDKLLPGPGKKKWMLKRLCNLANQMLNLLLWALSSWAGQAWLLFFLEVKPTGRWPIISTVLFWGIASYCPRGTKLPGADFGKITSLLAK